MPPKPAFLFPASRPVAHGWHQHLWSKGGGDSPGGGEDAPPAHHQRGKERGGCDAVIPAQEALALRTPEPSEPSSRAVHLGSQDLKQQEFFLGCSKVSGKVDWKLLDGAVFQVFKVRGAGARGLLVL